MLHEEENKKTGWFPHLVMLPWKCPHCQQHLWAPWADGVTQPLAAGWVCILMGPYVPVSRRRNDGGDYGGLRL